MTSLSSANHKVAIVTGSSTRIGYKNTSNIEEIVSLHVCHNEKSYQE